MPPSAPRNSSGTTSFVRLLTGTFVAAGAVLAAVVWPSAQVQSPAMDLVVGRNVNMVSGQTLPNGDPYLQRQNEPSVAASTRNPLHLLAGANDYRTVDIPGNFDDGETGDAWLGVFKSFDGGERWQSTLLPGYPQDTSAEGMASPLKAYHAGADPVVRPGTNGLLYYAGLAFNRGEGGASAIFVSRFVDNNNKENGDPIAYISTSIVASSTGAAFLDKPWLAVDVPRAGAKVCRINTQQAAPQLTAAAREQLAQRSKGADGRAVSAAAQTIKTTRTTKGTPTVLPTPGVAKTTTVSQQVLAGAMYVAYAQITTTTLATGASDIESRIMFSRSDDCGATWSKPVQISDPAHKVNQGATIAVDPSTGVVHVAWRQFGLTATAPDAIMTVTPDLSAKVSTKTSKKPVRVHEFKPGPKADAIQPKLQRAHRHGDVHQLVSIRPFDSGTGEDRFRTNAYPTIAIDDESRVYLAWTERGYAGARPDALIGDARVVLATSTATGVWSAPRAVDSRTDGTDLPGHQMMPSMSYSGGRLLIVYYDLRQDVSQVFGPFVSEADAVSTANRRHTIDVRAVQATKGDAPVFGASTMVSQYLMGNLRGEAGTSAQQLQFNAPNLPLFQLGTVPFMGDYIDVAPAPAFVQNTSGTWIHNTANTSAPVFHAVWTDNRDVQKPKDGDWQNYTPPGGATCAEGQTGMRNQNVYSARLTMGLIAGSPGNTKPLSTDTPRGFVVFAQNLTYQTKAFRLTIQNQPTGGNASFNQLGLAEAAPLLLTVDVKVAPRSMVTRTVYATSANAREQVRVSITEVGLQDFLPIVGGLATTVVLNPDISNPDISNPDISNPDISNPDISNAEVYNPDISNPDISNPDISNPDISNPDISNPDISNVRIANPDISNPDISNPDISNPDISNPDISNPDISNPDISNGSLTDVTWTIKNDGNTTASFNVNLFLANQAAAAGGIKTQLVVHKTYKTPVSDGCVLKSQTQTVLVANVLNPTFKTAGDDTTFDPANPDISNTTLWLEPGGEGKITLRIVDPNPTDNIEINPVEDVTPVVQSLAVNTPQLDEPMPVPPATPLPTDPPAPPSPTQVMLAFMTQPANTLMGGPIPDVVVSAVAGTDPAPGVQVTLAIAINPSGGKLTGTVTLLTDAAGLATFAGLSIDRDGAGYRLSASASAAGALPVLSNAFTIGAVAPPPPLVDLTGEWSGLYSWNCGFGLSGSATIRFTINAPHFGGWLSNGTTTYLGGTAGASVARFTGALGASDPAGNLIQIIVNPGAPGYFANNEFVGTLSNPGVPTITGTANNGDSNGGCSAVTPPTGTFTITKTTSPFVVTSSLDAGAGSLREIMTLANTTLTHDTITFNIGGAGEQVIALDTPLPVVTTPMAVLGHTQSGYDGRPMVRVHGAGTAGYGFHLQASSIVRGLSLSGFGGAPAVLVDGGGTRSVIEQNYIGTDRNGAAGLGNNAGVMLSGTTNVVVRQNLVSGNAFSGVIVVGGNGNEIRNNKIGTGLDGLGNLPNLDNGVTLYDGAFGTVIDGNLISGNGTIGSPNGYGIDIQQSGGLADVTNTVITNNVIGLDANGNLIERGGRDYVDAGPGLVGLGQENRGNSGGGIRVIRGSGTIIGTAAAGNTISGNTRSGIQVSGPMAVAPVIRGNRIGTDPTGTMARGNRRGVEVFGGSAATVGTPGAGNGNLISGNTGDGVAAGGNTVIENNLVGVDPTASFTIGNGRAQFLVGGLVQESGCCHSGITVTAPNNTVRGNVVGGSAANTQDPGISSRGGGAQPNIIEDNFVGVNPAGTIALPNGVGVASFGSVGTIIRRNTLAHNRLAGAFLVEGSQGNVLGGLDPADGNIIRNNDVGVIVGYNGADNGRVAILSNRIYANTSLGIDLAWNGLSADDPGDGDAGPNGLQNHGALSNVNAAGATTSVDLTVDTDSTNVNYTVQVFASAVCDGSGFGEGQRLVGSFTRSSDGAGDIVTTLSLTEAVPAGEWLTATVTQVATGQTSEFSQCAQVPSTVVITSATPANGAANDGFMVLQGTNLPAGIGDVVAEVTSGAVTANGFWFPGASSSTAAYVRLPGLPLGAATVRLRNNAGTVVTNAFPITITAVPGTPVITAIRDGSFNVVAAPVAAGTAIWVGAYGTDTTGAVVRFTQGATTWDVAAGAVASNDVLGLIAQVNMPGDASTGTIDVSIRQGASAFSAPVTISVSNPGFIGVAGGPGGNPFGPVTCNPGSVLTALTGEAGSYVGQFTMWCAPVLAGPSLGAAVASAVIGIPGVGPTDYGAALTCPGNSAITGISGLAGNVGWGTVVASLSVRCTDVTTNAEVTRGPIGGGAPTPYSFMCPAGDEGIGFAGGFGGVLDRIGIVCGNRAAPQPEAETTVTAVSAPVTFAPPPSRPTPLTR